MKPPPVSEAHFQEQVTQLARLLHWRWLHVRRSIGKGNRWQTTTNVVGWPDLLLWHETQHRTLAVELKSATGTATPEQIDTLASLEQAGVETHIWRPTDWPLIEATLKGRT